MIVKDEAHVIERCLATVAQHINSWCIVDTGSTDRTKEVIAKALDGIPGALYERPWVDFATNRNQAWELALEHHRPASLMFIDADEMLALDGLIPPMAQHSAFLIDVHYQGCVGHRFWMVRADYPHRWVGKVHEDIQGYGWIAKMEKAKIISTEDGARSKCPTKKIHGDLKVLLETVQADPTDARSWYYLGVTFAKAHDYDQAEKAFRVRIQMGGNPDEIRSSEDFLYHLAKARATQPNESAEPCGTR